MKYEFIITQENSLLLFISLRVIRMFSDTLCQIHKNGSHRIHYRTDKTHKAYNFEFYIIYGWAFLFPNYLSCIV